MRVVKTTVLAVTLTAMSATAIAQTGPVLLRQGTPVVLKNRFELNTKAMKAGDRFEFELADHLKVNGVVVVPAGAVGVGQVTRVVKNGSFGRSGKIDTRLLYIDYRGQHIDLDGQVNDRGKGGTIGTIAAIAAAGVIAGAFVHGTSGKIKQEAPMTAYVRWDTPVVPAGAPIVYGAAMQSQATAAAPMAVAPSTTPKAVPAPGFKIDASQPSLQTTAI